MIETIFFIRFYVIVLIEKGHIPWQNLEYGISHYICIWFQKSNSILKVIILKP
jgi:hypothetical protein